MTRKKYERDTYNDEYYSDTSSSDDSVAELTNKEIYNIIESIWDPWKDSELGDWNDPVDIYNFIYLKHRRCRSYDYALCISEEEEISLLQTITILCQSLNIYSRNKVRQVVQDILDRRNRFTFIQRSNRHWTRKWSKKLKESESLLYK